MTVMLLASAIALSLSRTILSAHASFSLDTSFGTGGIVTNENGGYAQKVALQFDGKAVVVGDNINNGHENWEIERYSVNGNLDTSFGTNGVVSQDFGFSNVAHAVSIQADGKIVVDGSNGGPWTVGRYNSNGTLDPSFGNNGISTLPINGISNGGSVQGLALQPDSKIVSVGYANYNTAVIVRQNPDGTLDQTFGNGGIVSIFVAGAPLVRVHGVTIQPQDGKIIIIGDYDFGAGGAHIFIYRVNTDGSTDTTFGNNGLVTDYFGFHDSGIAIQTDSNGKIVATGYFSYYDASGTRNNTYVIRYNEDGTHDNSFGSGGFVINPFATINDHADGIAIQSDNKIVLAGFNIDTSGSFTDFAVRRFNTDGSMDQTFGNNGSIIVQIGTIGSFAISVAIQTDGNILAVGGHGTGWALTRYQPGNLDTTPPVLSLPNSITIDATSPAGTIVSYTATSTDDDGTSPTVHCSPISGSTFSMGITIVSCSATDKAGNTATGEFTVTVKGADAQLSDLKGEVQGVGPGSSLTDKITAAQNDFRSGKNADACSQLAAFLHEVQVQAGKKLTMAQAQELESEALRIQAVIGC